MRKSHDPLEEAMWHTLDIMAEYAHDLIDSGEGFVRNAPSTIARKGRDAPLKDTEILMDSICGVVTMDEDGYLVGGLDAVDEENRKKLWINEDGVPGLIPPRPVITRTFDEIGDAALDEGLEMVADDIERIWGNK